MTIAILAVVSPGGEQGGAERFYQGLQAALEQAGAPTEILTVVSDESNFEAIKTSYLRYYDLDLNHYKGVISTKAPGYVVRHPNHICYLQHTMRVFYDMFEVEFPQPNKDLFEQRAFIQRLDTAALQPPRTRRIFTIGHQVKQRLLQFNDLDSEVLYQASTLRNFYCNEYRYVFMPGRLHRWKRTDLAIKAMQHVHAPIELLIAGIGEDEEALRRLAAGDSRIHFLGRVTDDELLNLYANALVIPFTPLREDFGLVTLEAFHSGKPVITCRDSGEPATLVLHEQTGFICEPEPQALAERIEQLALDPALAAKMGRQGEAFARRFTWENVATTLLTALNYTPQAGKPATRSISALTGAVQPSEPAAASLKITVLDMQPIDPPVGGGRLRLLGLYHALGEQTQATYVGTYDWPGPKHRRHRLSSTLEEIDAPLSPAHFAAAAALRQQVNGKVVIDAAFHQQAHLSPDYIDTARRAAQEADVVVFSHPWAWPLLADMLTESRPLLVYDSHNVEGLLRLSLLDDGGVGSAIVREVVRIEYKLCRAADLVLACSQEDRLLFGDLYNIRLDKIRVIPNGAFTRKSPPATAQQRATARRHCNVTKDWVVIFLGSNYAPNLEAATFIISHLAPRFLEVEFIIAGGVGDGLTSEAIAMNKPANVRITGVLQEEEKDLWLAAADLAVNPMFSGSGTNIKMFDFMAAGLPIVATPVGARGVDMAGQSAFVVCEAADFVDQITMLLKDRKSLEKIAKAGFQLVERKYSWERISATLGKLFRRYAHNRKRPFFSVIIPTYERHQNLTQLVKLLAKQDFRDFEVIIVDQSKTPWLDCNKDYGIDLFYYHTDIKGAVSARNTGVVMAKGQVIAFTDDDCQPASCWLNAARIYFNDPDVVGVEGLIKSSFINNPNWRAVTNEGAAGIGFMTANLFIKHDVFNRIDGFDEAFDHPHFREDTELAWRALQYGKIPFSSNAWVFHPPHPRNIKRESHDERVKFFEKDALLMKKHPQKYRELFFREGHWSGTPGFWTYFMEGAIKYNVKIPNYILESMNRLKTTS